MCSPSWSQSGKRVSWVCYQHNLAKCLSNNKLKKAYMSRRGNLNVCQDHSPGSQYSCEMGRSSQIHNLQAFASLKRENMVNQTESLREAWVQTCNRRVNKSKPHMLRGVQNLCTTKKSMSSTRPAKTSPE